MIADKKTNFDRNKTNEKALYRYYSLFKGTPFAFFSSSFFIFTEIGMKKYFLVHPISLEIFYCEKCRNQPYF